jgi:hypothetical protein
MFNQVSPPEKAKGLSAPAKLIVSVASVLLGFGLCSVSLANGGDRSTSSIALVGLAVSFIGLVACVLWLIVVAIINPLQSIALQPEQT